MAPPPAPLPLPEALLGIPAQRGARLLCRQFASEASSALAGIEADGAAGAAARHEMRVALRRLRVTLDAYQPVLSDTLPERLSQRVRALARRLGAARDRDVHETQIHSLANARTPAQRATLSKLDIRVGPDDERLNADKIRQRWRRIAKSLHEGADRWHEIHLLDDAQKTPTFAIVAADAVDHAANRIARRFMPSLRPDDLAAMHTARLALKSARYLLAPLADADDDASALVAAFRQAQTQLGVINDATLLRIRLHDLLTHRPDTAPPSRAVIRVLDACLRDLDSRIASAFDALAEWREPESVNGFVARLHNVATRWRNQASLPMEIERKWLLSALPPRVRGLTPSMLRQGYLPGETLVERIRSVTHGDTTRWIRTVKLGRGISRIEVEEHATDTIGVQLFALTQGKRVEKRRYSVDDAERIWEIDDFTDRDLVLAECELPHPDTLVEIPVWLAPYLVREVTGEAEFTNWRLAR